MPELERALTQLGGELDWPPTPDLAGAVRARLAGAGAQPAPSPEPVKRARRARRRFLPPAGLRRSLALALIALLLLAGTVLAAAPGVRDAVLELLGLQGVTVERRDTLPTPPPERPLELGSRTTLEAARASLAFTPLVPTDPAPPDGVYVRGGVRGGELLLAYRARPGLPKARSTRLGLLVSQFRGDLDPNYLVKAVGSRTRTERLSIDGERAIWIEGAPHFFFYRDPDGATGERELRLAQNVLLLERGPLLVRLEGAFSRERAIEIARSLGS